MRLNILDAKASLFFLLKHSGSNIHNGISMSITLVYCVNLC